MAKVSYIDLPDGIRSNYFRNVQPGNRYVNSRIVNRSSAPSRGKVEALKGRSILQMIGDAWASLDDDGRLAWSEAGTYTDMTGWRLFVADMSARFQNGLSGIATPVSSHQSWVGNINIASPASEIEIEQQHPRNYYLRRLIQGKQSMFETVLVTEEFSLPLTIQISYAADLSAVGGSPAAKYKATVWSVFQGEDIFTDLEIPLSLSTDWEVLSAELSTVVGLPIAYTLKLICTDVRGDLYFDNIKATHSGQNWCIDTFCDDINPDLPVTFRNVEVPWTPNVISEGATFQSIYKDF